MFLVKLSLKIQPCQHAQAFSPLIFSTRLKSKMFLHADRFLHGTSSTISDPGDSSSQQPVVVKGIRRAAGNQIFPKKRINGLNRHYLQPYPLMHSHHQIHSSINVRTNYPCPSKNTPHMPLFQCLHCSQQT